MIATEYALNSCPRRIGTAIGTGINADEGYLRRIVPNLTEISGMDFIQAFDLIDSTQNLDPFVAVSGAVKACGGKKVVLTANAQKQAKQLEALGFGNCPIC